MRFPDIEAFEERAAVIQYEGKVTRRQAENWAGQEQGFDGSDDYWGWLADYVVNKSVPR